MLVDKNEIVRVQAYCPHARFAKGWLDMARLGGRAAAVLFGLFGAWQALGCGGNTKVRSASSAWSASATPFAVKPIASVSATPSAVTPSATPSAMPSASPVQLAAVELIGKRGPALASSLRAIDSDASWTKPEYDRLFPKRLGRAACQAQKRALSHAEAAAQGLIYPWIYAVANGQFTALRAQKAYRIGITYCAPKLLAEVHHFVRIAEDGAPSLDFAVQPGVQLYRSIDIDKDGIDELVVEWHRLPTPQIFEGAHSIVSVADGTWRELYRSHFTPNYDCTQRHPTDEIATLVVTPAADGSWKIEEQLWRARCDPQHPAMDEGVPMLTDAASSTLSRDAVPAGTEPILSAAPAAPPSPEPDPRFETDATGRTVRQPAPDPVAAVCHPSNACRCPDFSGFPEGQGRAWLLRSGSFSGPFSEALVSVMMCEAHSNNFGGTALVRRTPSGWLPIGYVPGFVPRHCESHRGTDGLERLACVESYGLNQGTYSTSATVVDFAARQYDVLLESLCEDARDVRSVRWLSQKPSELGVEVVIEAGERRDNTNFTCRTTGGKARPWLLGYQLEPTGYVATPQTEARLAKLAPAQDPPLDPSVRAALAQRPGMAAQLPEELRPKRRPLDYTEVK